MKKIIFLLFPLLTLAQNPTNFPYGIKNPAATSDSAPAYFTTTQVDGVHKKTPAANVEKTANKSDSYTASSSTTYASTKALVDGLATKQAALVSGTNIKTIEGQSLLGSGNIDLNKADVGLSNVDNTSDVNKPISTATQTALDLKENSFAKNTAFNKNFGTAAGTVVEGNDSRLSDARTPLSHTLDSHSNVTITTNSNGEILKWNGTAWVNNTLVEAGIQPAGTYATGGGSATGTNTGDNAVNSLYSGLVTNATHTGDVTGATALTLATVNSNVGTFGNASNSTTQTVNAKGLTTAISNVPIQIAKSQVTELVSDLANVEKTANKSDSYTASSSTTYASTKALVDGLGTKVGGTLTTNYIPKATGASALGNSIVQEVGSEIKITGTFLVDNLITVTNKNQYINLINSGLIKHQTKLWNGSAFVDSSNGLFLGINAGLNNTGSNIGLISGYFSGLNNTGSNIGLISGSSAGQSNTGSNIGLISGINAGQSNTGSSIGLISGNSAGQRNIGSNIGLISGINAGYYNTGSNIGLISGTSAGLNNTGSNIGLISGSSAGLNNTGSNIGLISGDTAGQYNTGENNILGYHSHSAFLDNASGIKVATAVDINTDYVTITAHNFGATNAYANLRYTTDGTSIGGLANNGIYKVKIIDANTIFFYVNNLSSAGTGNHSFTPQYQYTNVNIFGNNVNPTKSNQTIIGNPSTTEFIAYGTHLIGTTVNNGVDKLQVNGTISATSYTGGATLTGTPTAPTATVGTNTTQIATTAFVQAEKNLIAHWTKTGDDITNNNTGKIYFGAPATGGVSGVPHIASSNQNIVTSGQFASTVGYGFADQSSGLFESGGKLLLKMFNPKGVGIQNVYQNHTSGTQNDLSFVGSNINPTSGNAVFNNIAIESIINQTGGANGITRGIYINPTLTSAFDFRAIEVTTGKVIVPVTTETAIQEYADNAAAVTAGLTIGTHYRTGDLLKIVH